MLNLGSSSAFPFLSPGWLCSGAFCGMKDMVQFPSLWLAFPHLTFLRVLTVNPLLVWIHLWSLDEEDEEERKQDTCEKCTTSEVGCMLSRWCKCLEPGFFPFEFFGGCFYTPPTWSLWIQMNIALYWLVPLSSSHSHRSPTTLASPSTTSFLHHLKMIPLNRLIDLFYLPHLTPSLVHTQRLSPPTQSQNHN